MYCLVFWATHGRDGGESLTACVQCLYNVYEGEVCITMCVADRTSVISVHTRALFRPCLLRCLTCLCWDVTDKCLTSDSDYPPEFFNILRWMMHHALYTDESTRVYRRCCAVLFALNNTLFQEGVASCCRRVTWSCILYCFCHRNYFYTLSFAVNYYLPVFAALPKNTYGFSWHFRKRHTHRRVRISLYSYSK